MQVFTDAELQAHYVNATTLNSNLSNIKLLDGSSYTVRSELVTAQWDPVFPIGAKVKVLRRSSPDEDNKTEQNATVVAHNADGLINYYKVKLIDDQDQEVDVGGQILRDMSGYDVGVLVQVDAASVNGVKYTGDAVVTEKLEDEQYIVQPLHIHSAKLSVAQDMLRIRDIRQVLKQDCWQHMDHNSELPQGAVIKQDGEAVVLVEGTSSGKLDVEVQPLRPGVKSKRLVLRHYAEKEQDYKLSPFQVLGHCATQAPVVPKTDVTTGRRQMRQRHKGGTPTTGKATTTNPVPSLLESARALYTTYMQHPHRPEAFAEWVATMSSAQEANQLQLDFITKKVEIQRRIDEFAPTDPQISKLQHRLDQTRLL